MSAPPRNPYAPPRDLPPSLDFPGWLLPRDPRRLALLFAGVLLLCVVGGGGLALVMSGEMYSPDLDLVPIKTYDPIVTLHGLLLGAGFMIPAIPTTLGQFAVPRQLGVARLPWISCIGLYSFIASIALLVASSPAGSTLPGEEEPPELLLGIAGVVLSASLTAVGLVLTAIRRDKRRGAMPLFAWSLVLGALATLVSVVMHVGLGLLDPSRPGRPIGEALGTLARLALLPALGVVCEILEVHARGFAARRLVLGAFVTLAVVALPLWQWIPAGAYVAHQLGRLAVLLVLCTWTLLLVRHARNAGPPLRYALAAVVTLLLAGIAGIGLTEMPDNHLNDTYFLVGQFHLRAYVVLLAMLGGLHHWWHDLTGRRYHAASARLGAALVWSGMTFHGLTLLLLGHAGMPRRYYAYLPEFTNLHRLTTLGAALIAAGLLWAAATLARSAADERAA